MTRIVCLFILFLPTIILGQITKRSSLDSLGSHKLVMDKFGKILAWYKPEIPGASYAYVSKLASEFIKTGTPIEPYTGLPIWLRVASRVLIYQSLDIQESNSL